MTLELAQQYVGTKAKWQNVEGKITEVREITADSKTGRKMVLAYIEGGAVFNVDILRGQTEEGKWVSLDQIPL
jgi:hypothetical protein